MRQTSVHPAHAAIRSPWTWRFGLFFALPWSGLAQEFAIGSPSVLTCRGSSADATFAIQGQLSALPTERLVGEAYTIIGTLQNLVPGNRAPATERVNNGGFEDFFGIFAPAADGTQTLGPNAPGENLLPYGDAEGLGDGTSILSIPIPGWTLEGPLSVVPWDSPDGWPLRSDPGPAERGVNFFAGGPDDGLVRNLTTATTRITLPADAGLLDAGQVTFEMSGWFGGFQGQADTAALRATFLDAAGESLESLLIGAPTPEQRQNRTALIYDSLARSVPAGARQAEVVLEMRRQANLGWNDGYADNLRFALRGPSEKTLPGWDVVGEDVQWWSNLNPVGPRSPSGTLFVDLTGSRSTPPYGGVAQSIPTDPGQTYELRFALGTYEDLPAFRGPVGVTVSAGPVTKSFTFAPEVASQGSQWRTFAMPFTATDTTTRISLVGLQSDGGAFIGLDQVAVVPTEQVENPLLTIALPSLSPGASELELRFPSSSGQLYRIQRADALAGAPWEDVSGTERVGDGREAALHLQIASSVGARFYRVRVGP